MKRKTALLAISAMYLFSFAPHLYAENECTELKDSLISNCVSTKFSCLSGKSSPPAGQSCVSEYAICYDFAEETYQQCVNASGGGPGCGSFPCPDSEAAQEGITASDNQSISLMKAREVRFAFALARPTPITFSF